MITLLKSIDKILLWAKSHRVNCMTLTLGFILVLGYLGFKQFSLVQTPSLLVTYLPLPAISQVGQTEKARIQQKIPLSFTRIIRSGDTLERILKSQGIHTDSLPTLLNRGSMGKSLKQLKLGHEINSIKNKQGQLLILSYDLSLDKRLVFKRQGPSYSFKGSVETIPLDIRETYTTFTIKNSLFDSGLKHKVPYALLNQVITQFAWDIDFSRHIHPHDKLSLIYEECFRQGKKIGHRRLLAATITNRGKFYSIVLNTLAGGQGQYFTADGHSVHKRFLRAPVKYTHISSHFNLARRHPILHRIRAHRGVDYSANPGTPIMATGDGKISFQGWKNGYGQVIVIHHGQDYSTLYAHMSKFAKASKIGRAIKQGEVIGYVGATGLATAPHVHYEFHAKGKHLDPVKATLPKANPMSGAQRLAFLRLAKERLHTLKFYELAIYATKSSRNKA